MQKQELARLKTLCKYEEEARSKGFSSIAGVDEAGRGPLAGPVVAAACILPPDLLLEGINDSKKLTPGQRSTLFKTITAHTGICYGIGIVDPALIDQINVLRATFEAMKMAVAALSHLPDYLLVDGSLLPPLKISSLALIKGDTLSQSIAAASILAKETRDRIMIDYDAKMPQYGFAKHKGYGTKEHLLAIEKHGPSPIHRMSFQPLKSIF